MEAQYQILWKTFTNLIKEIGWYSTGNYKPYSASEFVAEFGEKISKEFREFIMGNVVELQRQCDNYYIKFIGE